MSDWIEGPEGTYYALCQGYGNNGENCYEIVFTDGLVYTGYINRAPEAGGIDGFIGRMLNPAPLPPPPVIIPYGVFRARWEPEEIEALFEVRNTHWQVDDYITLASGQGHVNLSGATAGQAKALFVSLGVLTVERAEAIFATG
jgi:hypothetical protein